MSNASLGRSLLAAAIPNYVVPAVMSGTSAFVLGDARLLSASYSTIAVPSAIAGVLVTLLLFERTPPKTNAQALRFGLAIALGALTIAAFVAGALVLSGLAPSTLLGDACPSAFIGAAMTVRAWSRRAGARGAWIDASARLPLLSVSTMAVFTTGCVGTAPPFGDRTAIGLPARPVEGASPTTFRAYDTVVGICSEWANLASTRSASSRRQAATAGALSTVAGGLAFASGAVTGALAGHASGDGDKDKATDIGLVGGLVTMGFGVVATISGIYTTTRASKIREADAAGAAIERAMSRHTLTALADAPTTRDAALAREAVAMLIECTATARAFEPELLDVSRLSPHEARIAAIVRDTPSGDPALPRRLEEALFSKGEER
ncbi:hypothetical protein [Labilithrix luteola]|nr:hypothetical protein [Labilithrix luteola]